MRCHLNKLYVVYMYNAGIWHRKLCNYINAKHNLTPVFSGLIRTLLKVIYKYSFAICIVWSQLCFPLHSVSAVLFIIGVMLH